MAAPYQEQLAFTTDGSTVREDGCEFQAAAAHVVESFLFVACRLVHSIDVGDR